MALPQESILFITRCRGLYLDSTDQSILIEGEAESEDGGDEDDEGGGVLGDHPGCRLVSLPVFVDLEPGLAWLAAPAPLATGCYYNLLPVLLPPATATATGCYYNLLPVLLPPATATATATITCYLCYYLLLLLLLLAATITCYLCATTSCYCYCYWLLL